MLQILPSAGSRPLYCAKVLTNNLRKDWDSYQLSVKVKCTSVLSKHNSSFWLKSSRASHERSQCYSHRKKSKRGYVAPTAQESHACFQVPTSSCSLGHMTGQRENNYDFNSWIEIIQGLKAQDLQPNPIYEYGTESWRRWGPYIFCMMPVVWIHLVFSVCGVMSGS